MPGTKPVPLGVAETRHKEARIVARVAQHDRHGTAAIRERRLLHIPEHGGLAGDFGHLTDPPRIAILRDVVLGSYSGANYKGENSMIKLASHLTVILTAIAVCFVGIAVPAQAAPPSASRITSITSFSAPTESRTAMRKKMEVDFHWTSATVWYNKSETERIVAANGACGVIVANVPGWIAKILSTSCGLIAVWAGYARARNRCVGVKVSYAMAIPYDWTTRAC